MVIKYYSNYYNLDLVYKFYITDSNDTITLYYQTNLQNSNPPMKESIYIDGKTNPQLFVVVKEYLLSKYTGYSKE